jgi:hypothetical protein
MNLFTFSKAFCLTRVLEKSPFDPAQISPDITPFVVILLQMGKRVGVLCSQKQ